MAICFRLKNGIGFSVPFFMFLADFSTNFEDVVVFLIISSFRVDKIKDMPGMESVLVSLIKGVWS